MGPNTKIRQIVRLSVTSFHTNIPHRLATINELCMMGYATPYPMDWMAYRLATFPTFHTKPASNPGTIQVLKCHSGRSSATRNAQTAVIGKMQLHPTANEIKNLSLESLSSS